MGNSGDEAGGRLRKVVAEARARLGRAAGRSLLLGRWPWAVGAGVAAAMSRPLLWRLGEEAPLWSAPARALALFAAGTALSAGALVVAGRRRGPSEVGAARALGRFAGAALLALAVGSYDPAVATALAAPPSAIEREAAAELEEAAAEIAAAEKKEAKKPAPERSSKARDKGDERLGSAGPALADKARQAARAARRGDRKGALEKLEELRAEGQARAGDLSKALRKVAEALAPPSAEKAGSGAPAGRESAPSAAESTRLLAEKLQKPEGGPGEARESNERTLERLERAAEEARRAASESGSKEASEAARSLSRAAADLKRGDRAAASQALAEAAQRMASMEQAREAARREAEAIADMLERSGMLERAVQAAMLGREGEGQGEKGEKGEGKGEGQGQGEKGEGQGGKPGAGAELRAAILARLVAMGAAETKSFDQPGSGPHIADRQRSKRAALPVEGAIKAPSQVGEGPRAIQAMQGLGRGTEPPKEYREVFPSYDAAAEEGLADERVPAARRAAVRRYFQAIRPE
jgi:hypothetical protein